MLHQYRLVPLALICFLFLSTSSVHAHPIRAKREGATTVHTVHTTQTGDGPVTETCEITLTPIIGKNGQPAVQEVRKCSLTFADAGGHSPSGTTTATLCSGTATSGIPSSTIPTSATSIPTNPASSNIPPVIVVSSNSSPTHSMPGATTTDTKSLPITVATTATLSLSSSTAQGSGTSAPDSSASSTAAFQLPGKTLSVLPIGLGVFAGISVIALIVVGLVTYERTKYRKAFRQRKLAESGAGMGYGGMAQRP